MMHVEVINSEIGVRQFARVNENKTITTAKIRSDLFSGQFVSRCGLKNAKNFSNSKPIRAAGENNKFDTSLS